jgi:hypothetical protein
MTNIVNIPTVLSATGFICIMLNQSINNLNLQPCPISEDHNERGRTAQFPLQVISFPCSKFPVHILQDIVSAFFVRPPCIAIISHGLHTYKQACINYYVLHLLTGTLNYFVVLTFVAMLSIQVNCIKVFVLM